MDVPASGGVYRFVNRLNGHCYVGSSKCVRSRHADHKCQLQSGIHHSKPFQRAWDKYGPDAFDFEMLEYFDGPLPDLRAKERHWCRILKPEYNVRQVIDDGFTNSEEAREATRQRNRLRVWTPESRAKASLAKQGFTPPFARQPRSPETRARQSRSRTGKKHTPEVRAKMSASRKGMILHPSTSAAITRTNLARTAEDWVRIGAKVSAKKRERDALQGGHKQTDEARAKIAAAKREYWRLRHEATPPSSASEGDALEEESA